MKFDVEELDGGITLVVLAGQMDLSGTADIDLKFATLAGSKAKMVVDLSGVTFLASIGIRTLIINAKAMKSRGHRMVLLNPQPAIANVLETTGVDQLIPMVKDMAAAVARLSPPPQT